MENSQLTPEKSLEIITSAIKQGQKDFARTSAIPLLVWGFVSFFCALAVWTLWRQSGNPQWNLLWYAMIPVGFLLSWLLTRNRPRSPKSFISRTISGIWILYGCIAIGTAVIYFFFPKAPITTLIIFLLGTCTAITGVLFKNVFISASGLLTSLIGTQVLYLLNTQADETLILAFSILLCLIVPGFLIRNFAKK